MRWIAALAAGAFAAVALFATFYGYKSFEDWQSGRAEFAARIATLEGDTGNPNRNGNLKAARELLDLTNGVATEKIGLSALALALAAIACAASWRYAGRFPGRGRLVLIAVLGALLQAALAAVVVVVLGLGAIRG